ncbi:MAG: hypothetical protein P4N59_21585 [Negativicutes bacterium]|nr:hypothetical protein [Negativicutes bacterium]
MGTIFKEKGSRFGAMTGLIAVSAMLAWFFLTLPDFLVSVAGRAFAVVWALTAVLIFLVHARRLAPERRRYPRYLAAVKDIRTKSEGERRLQRG